ncbi:LOW QUALITY PROTEIN: zona pellucida sperm-binding protein 4 [Pteronotus mesoamericanus]|uniref:LOW QUALITY PROTEIN: zona pellucida sperm-binding protein 4 n=1 Tax=Pteronotus mesoamericanus TaxID=1884717 RepID=UPI0023EB55DE|nr:LOW QUALITY PROTEIN: zona pellucida sperm-binding protein 4 [Pteronotus parnellii mesoamericanus]
MWLRSLLLCLPLALALALNGPREPEGPEDAGELHCGPRGLRLTTPPPRSGDPCRPADKAGLLHRLHNDSGCGVRVTEGAGGSVVAEASYSGCFVTEWDSNHIMLVGVEGMAGAGHGTAVEARLLKCPTAHPAPSAPGADVCDAVPAWGRLPCVPSPTTQGGCQRLGCCYSSTGNSCYYGNTGGGEPEAGFSYRTAQTKQGPPERGPIGRLQAPSHSLSSSKIAGGQALYENELVAARDVRMWSQGWITRDSTFRVRVSCTYAAGSHALPLAVQVLLVPAPRPQTQPGPLTPELQIAKDKNYSAYYGAGHYPVLKFLREPIPVEVSIRHRTDADLGLRLRQRWATPSPGPLRRPQWALLVGGERPYAGDDYRTQLIPVQAAAGLPFPAHHQRFSISTFSFVDSGARRALRGPVHLHCSVSVCQPAGAPSWVTCPVVRRRRSSDIDFHNSPASISSKGPMILLQATQDTSEKLHKDSGSPVASRALWVAGLSGTLIVGVLLVSCLAIKKEMSYSDQMCQ